MLGRGNTDIEDMDMHDAPKLQTSLNLEILRNATFPEIHW